MSEISLLSWLTLLEISPFPNVKTESSIRSVKPEGVLLFLAILKRKEEIITVRNKLVS